MRAWPPSQQKWWRELLEEHPNEATRIAELAADLGAWPCDELGYPIAR